MKRLTLLKKSRTEYPESPELALLKVFPNAFPKRDYWIRFDCPEFTSICPVTGQPDFGKIVIEYIPKTLCVESKSLKIYLGSYRNHGSFGETIVNQILNKLVHACKPRKAVVTGEFTPRGVIVMRVTASYP